MLGKSWHWISCVRLWTKIETSVNLFPVNSWPQHLSFAWFGRCRLQMAAGGCARLLWPLFLFQQASFWLPCCSVFSHSGWLNQWACFCPQEWKYILGTVKTKLWFGLCLVQHLGQEVVNQVSVDGRDNGINIEWLWKSLSVSIHLFFWHAFYLNSGEESAGVYSMKTSISWKASSLL